MHICNPTINKNCQGLTLVLLEKNSRYGCSDFTGTGDVTYNKNKNWAIVLNNDVEEGKMPWANASINEEQLTGTKTKITIKTFSY